MATLVHSRFVAKQAGFFPSLVTIQANTPTQDSYGQPVESWANVGAWVNLACAKAPLSAQERQANQYTATDQVWHALLRGAYPTITTAHRAVVDGTNYDIDAVETDQTGSLTRLRLRTVEV